MSASTLQRELQALVLPSGRTLAFAEYGKPNGRPVIYLHGFPMCRLEALAFDAPARRANIRLIAPDRPGIGQSSFVLNREILDHAGDVKAIAKHLNLKSFAVLGVSGGAPYALACARKIEREMLSGVGIFSGMGTFERKELVPLGSRLVGWLARNFPSTLRVVTDVFVAGLRRMVRWGWVQRMIDQSLEGAKKSKNEWEKDILVQNETAEKWTAAKSRERLVGALFEPFKQGSGGVVQEAALVSQGWGFKLEDVKYLVKIWHGSKDVNAPIEWVRVMAGRLPNGMLREYEGDTHGGLVKHIDAVFAELLGEDKVEGLTKKRD
ncbi:hypothetical protein N0V90_004269 [Kalmusia sp. IMI 367209]|nr:hypothetical protein N0V90_004269 [Kalmusia sp. IMI 367209]